MARWRARTIAILAITGAALVAVTLPTFADSGPGAASGSWAVKVGPAATATNASNGSAYWNATVSPKTLTLSTYGVSMATGMCETTYFDWGLTPVTHYDARAVRTCQNSWSVANSWADSKSTIGGVQKLGICYALNNTLQSGTGATCTQYPGRTGDISGIPPSFTTGNCSVSWKKRTAAGVETSYSGGSPTSATC